MDIRSFDSYEALSMVAATLILEAISAVKEPLLCAATGGSPTKTYQFLAKEYKRHPHFFDQLRVLKLDEWGGVPMNHPETCEAYLQRHLIEPLKIPKAQYISFESNPGNPDQECARVQTEMTTHGPIDICLLGLGMNGHIALNEPADVLQPNCHVARLSESSQQHPMAAGMETKPTYGLTLGMADILHSKLIIMLISGEQKKEIATRFLAGRITTELPASFLWLHPNLVCLVDNEAMPKTTRRAKIT